MSIKPIEESKNKLRLNTDAYLKLCQCKYDLNVNINL